MKHLLSSITLILLSTLAFGQVPNTFSSGETISSSKINANFAYVASAIKNDNITAMMVCGMSGFYGDDFYFSRCSSTDDQSFQDIAIKNILQKKDSTSMSEWSITNSKNSISLTNVFNNNWVLFDSKIIMNDVNEGQTYDRMYLYQFHIFYKVSSD